MSQRRRAGAHGGSMNASSFWLGLALCASTSLAAAQEPTAPESEPAPEPATIQTQEAPASEATPAEPTEATTAPPAEEQAGAPPASEELETVPVEVPEKAEASEPA